MAFQEFSRESESGENPPEDDFGADKDESWEEDEGWDEDEAWDEENESEGDG